ncbi:MAG TPA: methylated-DNA--[protein]-cysteine S-methyltransferase [Syntrophorhabdaceae bacterium]|jgi:methylated-DNA-[protein]-cysteine S-methyltransferase
MALIEFSIRESSLGNLILVAREGKVIELDIRGQGSLEIRKALVARFPDGIESDRPFRSLHVMLDRYLRGQKVDFTVDVDLSQEGEFTQRVLKALMKVPHGELTSYGRLAAALGYRNAAQAVGQALGRNPIPIIIPCHRVIRSDGTIGGFSMGLKYKERLLALEGIRLRSCYPFYTL